MTRESGKKKRTPQILRKDTMALKLAEKWVANMTTPAGDDPPIEAEQEVRPPRLALGAQVSRQMMRRPSDDPLDQKLRAKFDAGRRKHARSDEAESSVSIKNAGDDSEDDDDESESKSKAFGKKRRNTSTRR